MLHFIGTGSAFNTELGNNSAFIKEKESLLLIDCGGMTFHRIQQLALLDGTKSVCTIITHMHPDHIGSLGEVIFYCYFILGFKATIIFPDEKLIRSYLRLSGASDEMYHLQAGQQVEIEDMHLGKVGLQFMKNSHVDTIPAYSFLMKSQKGTCYYSGDANTLPESIIALLEGKKIDVIYQDTCGIEYEGNAHLSLTKLEKLIPVELRSKVYCMHLDKHIKVEEIEALGFNCVRSV